MVDINIRSNWEDDVVDENIHAAGLGSRDPESLVGKHGVGDHVVESLEAGSFDYRGGGDGVGVATQRKVAIDKCDTIAIIIDDAGHHRLDASAVRAREIRPFDETKLGIRVAANVVADLAVIIVGTDDGHEVVGSVIDRGPIAGRPKDKAKKKGEDYNNNRNSGFVHGYSYV